MPQTAETLCGRVIRPVSSYLFHNTVSLYSVHSRVFNETWHKYSLCSWALLKRFQGLMSLS